MVERMYLERDSRDYYVIGVREDDHDRMADLPTTGRATAEKLLASLQRGEIPEGYQQTPRRMRHANGVGIIFRSGDGYEITVWRPDAFGFPPSMYAIA